MQLTEKSVIDENEEKSDKQVILQKINKKYHFPQVYDHHLENKN